MNKDRGLASKWEKEKSKRADYIALAITVSGLKTNAFQQRLLKNRKDAKRGKQ
jgi:hypothetical protein